MSYSISLMEENDVNLVQDFIHNEWKQNHILSQSRTLFDWQYLNKNGEYNFVIAKQDLTIIGILGFIPHKKYDKNIEKNYTIWLSLWKVSENNTIPGIGLKMIFFLKKIFKNYLIAVNGINTEVANIYKALGFKIGSLNHFYVTNENLEKKIISNSVNYELPKLNKKGYEWEKLTKNNLKNLDNPEYYSEDIFNQTSLEYIKNRYLDNPFYNYSVYKITNSQIKKYSCLVLRYDSIESSNVIRIVDYIGDPNLLLFAGYGLNKIMINNSVEYADFWSYGISEKIMNNIGFKKVDNNVIVPNYFEPFLRKNISINFAYQNPLFPNKYPLTFKGDGDQDRPNKL